MFRAERTTEYDLLVTAEAGRGESLARFVAALRKAGFRAWKVGTRAYQVSFDGHPELLAELPPIGSEYTIHHPKEVSR